MYAFILQQKVAKVPQLVSLQISLIKHTCHVQTQTAAFHKHVAQEVTWDKNGKCTVYMIDFVEKVNHFTFVFHILKLMGKITPLPISISSDQTHVIYTKKLWHFAQQHSWDENSRQALRRMLEVRPKHMHSCYIYRSKGHNNRQYIYP